MARRSSRISRRVLVDVVALRIAQNATLQGLSMTAMPGHNSTNFDNGLFIPKPKVQSAGRPNFFGPGKFSMLLSNLVQQDPHLHTILTTLLMSGKTA